MIRILFLVLWGIPVLGLKTFAAVEVYANGHKYGSVQTYQASKKSALTSSPESLDKQQEDYIRQRAQELGIKVDFHKVKTLYVNQKTNASLHQLYVLSVENGVIGALQDFYQNLGPFGFQIPRQISTEQLQKVIQKAVTTSKTPKLLISAPGKVRIMSLTAGH